MTTKESIVKYCLYQPRSHKEVKNKLYELGCTTPEVEELIIELIQAGHLNEEHFARSLARGKFRMKHWGRRKIIEQLKLQQVSERCIKLGLSEIDEEEYRAVAIKLADKKFRELKGNRSNRLLQQKVFRYMMQKGYETNIIREAINETLN